MPDRELPGCRESHELRRTACRRDRAKVRRTEYEARSLIFSGQLGHPFFSIRVTLEVSSCSVEEPLQSVFDTTSCNEGIGVGVEQPSRSFTGTRCVQILGLQCDNCLIELTEIHAGACDDDPQLRRLVARKQGSLVATAELDRAFWSTQTAFAVGHDSDQTRSTSHSTGSTKLGESFSPFTGVVRGDSGSFTNDRNSAGALTRSASVEQCKFRIFVDELARHDQVTRNCVGVVLVEAEQIPTNGRVQLGGLYVVGQIRFVRSCLLTVAVAVASTRGEPTLAAATLSAVESAAAVTVSSTATVVVSGTTAAVSACSAA